MGKLRLETTSHFLRVLELLVHPLTKPLLTGSPLCSGHCPGCSRGSSENGPRLPLTGRPSRGGVPLWAGKCISKDSACRLGSGAHRARRCSHWGYSGGFWLCPMACSILVPSSGMEHRAPRWKCWVLTIRKPRKGCFRKDAEGRLFFMMMFELGFNGRGAQGRFLWAREQRPWGRKGLVSWPELQVGAEVSSKAHGRRGAGKAGGPGSQRPSRPKVKKWGNEGSRWKRLDFNL